MALASGVIYYWCLLKLTLIPAHNQQMPNAHLKEHSTFLLVEYNFQKLCLFITSLYYLSRASLLLCDFERKALVLKPH